MTRLTNAEISSELRGLEGWTREGDALRRQFTFPSFPDAVAFIVRLAFHAEAADHHPDIMVNYRRVTLSYSTHSEQGITAEDIEGARTADACAR
jgi:4a-hydroxytetrahydrobiopterin dehydratase